MIDFGPYAMAVKKLKEAVYLTLTKCSHTDVV
jgi:hypothetical protein